MPTKTELETKVDELEQHVRRLERQIGQTALDQTELKERMVTWVKPPQNEHAQEAVKRGLQEWESVIKEPDQRINSYIRSCDGIGWTWEKDYVKNGQFAWCGAFAAFCWTHIKMNIRRKIFPSCWRMYNAWSQTSRCIDPKHMQPGDIVVISTAKKATQGDHITICREPVDENGMFKTIEGNARGELGDGTHGEGVVKCQRPLSSVAWVYRILAEDLDE